MIIKLDKIGNDYKKGSSRVANIVGKMRKNRLRWYEHVNRRYNEKIVKRVRE